MGIYTNLPRTFCEYDNVEDQDDRNLLLRRQAQHPTEPLLATQKYPKNRHLWFLLSIKTSWEVI